MRPSRAAAVHATLAAVSVVMLMPFYWVLKTSLTGENIFQYPPALLPGRFTPSTMSTSGTTSPSSAT